MGAAYNTGGRRPARPPRAKVTEADRLAARARVNSREAKLGENIAKIAAAIKLPAARR